MGLFYTALERADQAAAKDGEKGGGGEVAAPAATSPVNTWPEAAQRDLAGYPLAGAVGEVAAPPTADAVPSRAVRLDAVRLGLAANEAGIAKEQYRILRTRVLQAMRSQGLRSLLVTSAGAGEGKTTVAANLALQLSSLKEGRVLLMDADLRRAGLTGSLCPIPEVGLNHFLRGEAGLEELLYAVDPWLAVLPAQRTQEEGAELLAGQRMVELLLQVRERFDLVLLDGAPVGPVADSRILARLVDASILVVRAGVAPTEEIEQAAALLRPKLLGGVLNGACGRQRRYGYAYAAADAATHASAGPAPEVRP